METVISDKSIDSWDLKIFQEIDTPAYIVDEVRLRKNLEILNRVQVESGAGIILALKGFAMFGVFPLINKILRGTTASSLHEARLGYEEFGGEVHVYAPAYKHSEISDYIKYADHITFNSFGQWKQFQKIIQRSSKPVSCGLRINPEHSEVDVPLYDPCAPCSRLGMTTSSFKGESIKGVDGFHLHTLCGSDSDALERTLQVVEKNFGDYLHDLKWINLGGGHHITRQDYDLDGLCSVISHLRKTYGLKVYLEPGEAIALNAGVLVATVLDIFENEMNLAILDTSASAHMPDVLEMPYRPELQGAAALNEFPHGYRLGGATCLAGDVIGDYSFRTPLEVGDRLVFKDMAHYTMVKNTAFNGLNIPSIGICNSEKGTLKIIRKFGYEDYRSRLS
ncbi:MAG TPA: carboxynorspermidine decarboxylase [Verrucomicrobiales bacterium]|nr:carboxynorspermidine decarboxylase [Verrucomicrobiales bacterium]